MHPQQVKLMFNIVSVLPCSCSIESIEEAPPAEEAPAAAPAKPAGPVSVQSVVSKSGLKTFASLQAYWKFPPKTKQKPTILEIDEVSEPH